MLLPRNEIHLLGSDLSLPPVWGADVIRPDKDGGLFAIRHGGGGEISRVVCGFLRRTVQCSNPLIAALPSVIRQNIEESGGAAWIRSTFLFAADEVAKGRPGSETSSGETFRTPVCRNNTALCRDSARRPDGLQLAGLRDPYVSNT